MKRFWWSIGLAAVIAGVNFAAIAQGKVYLVIGSDTAIWDGLDITRQHCHFLPDLYTNPERNAYQVMSPAFRSRFVDSFGQQLKMSWWMLVGGILLESDNMNVPVPNLMPLHLMMKHQGNSIRAFGDEVSVHYHTFYWSDYNKDGVYYWNEALTFHESRPDFDLTLAQTFLEEGVFPVSFRSGWHYMDNEWQARLNEILPFSMHNTSPLALVDKDEPFANNLDWSKAATDFVPYHPASTNYQTKGNGSGWIAQSVKMQNMTQTIMDQMFANAATGMDQIACLWAHLPETDFLDNITRMDALAHTAAASHPTVQFRYCTAIEAMQRWMKATNQVPPQLDVTESTQEGLVKLTIQTSKSIFQPSPVIALKDVWEDYRLLQCAPAGSNTWTIALPVPKSELAKVGVAVTDSAGNLTTKIIRYLPDDLYLDNLDSQYSEPQGTWITTNKSAWGTDARIAVLASGGTARAMWSLPITNAGQYRILVQVPEVPNGASNVTFKIFSGGKIISTNLFGSGLPGMRWIPLATPSLDPATANYVEMTVTPGAGQSNAVAVADVVRVTQLVPGQSFIGNLQVDASDATVCVTWNTLASTTTEIHLGLDPNCDSASQSNAVVVTRHAATLTGLTPGTGYYFRINASNHGAEYIARGTFTTANYSLGSLQVRPPLSLRILQSENHVTLFWNGTGCTLQQASRLGAGSVLWTNVPGPVTASPYTITNGNAAFYRLRQ